MERVRHLVRLKHGELQQIVGWGRRQRSILLGGEYAKAVPGLRRDDHPGTTAAITFPNSSSTSAVPYRSTARMVAGEAWLGETPAAYEHLAKLAATVTGELGRIISEHGLPAHPVSVGAKAALPSPASRSATSSRWTTATTMPTGSSSTTGASSCPRGARPSNGCSLFSTTTTMWSGSSPTSHVSPPRSGPETSAPPAHSRRTRWCLTL